MSPSYRTARAFLESRNYAKAREIADSLIGKNSNDIFAILLLVEIEERQKNFDKALIQITRGLAIAPHNQILRRQELVAYVRLGKKRRARIGIQNFKRDFPSATDDHDFLSVIFESKFGSDRRAMKKLMKSPLASSSFAKGVYHTNAGALFEGQKYFHEARANDPNNFSINSNLAYNQFMLSRLWSARKAANRALQSQPDNFNMRWLIILTWLAHFPPVYYAHLLLSCYFLLHRWIPTWIIILSAVLILHVLIMPLFWFDTFISQLFNFPNFKWVTAFYAAAYFFSYLLFGSKLLRFLMTGKQNIRLKDY